MTELRYGRPPPAFEKKVLRSFALLDVQGFAFFETSAFSILQLLLQLLNFGFLLSF